MKSFDEVFEDNTKYGTKIKKEEYREYGKHIIVDQGQNVIAGYTDREDGLFTEVPAIVFGDHTRAIKYIDKPFFLGADGVKVLRSRYPDANYKYLYYALRNAEIPDTGYNRHFKWLKEIRINYPDAEKQVRVVEALDKAQLMIDARKEQIQKLDDLIKARFVEMFGDPVDNPMGWNTRPLLTMGSCKNGMNFHSNDFGVEINCLGVCDFKDYDVISGTHDLPTVSLNEMPAEDYLLKDGDIVFVRSNGNKTMVGRSVVVYPHDNPTTFSGFCIRYRLSDDSIMIPYLLRVLKADPVRKQMYGRGANIQNLNQKTLAALNIPVPPMEAQKQYAAFVQQSDKSKVVVQKALDEAQLLFDSLMQKYFG